MVHTRMRSLPPAALYTSKATALCSDSSSVPQEQVAQLVVAEQLAGLVVRQQHLGQCGGEVLERGGGGQVGDGRHDALAGLEPPAGEARSICLVG